MLSYLDVGCYNSEVIVFLHGLGSHKGAWKPQSELGFKYRLIMPDLRGHGETVLQTDITMVNMTRDVIELLENLGIEQAFICGLSLGGLVAQEIYRQKPELVKGLILANTAAYIDPILASSVLWYGYKHHTDPDFIDKIVDRGLYNTIYTEEAKKAFLIRDCYMEAAKAPVGVDYFPVLMKVDKPVLIISSDEDKVVPPLNQLFMRGALVKAIRPRRVMLKGTGHLSNIEQANEFNRLVDEFIEEEN